jgi:poly(A) polymerase
MAAISDNSESSLRSFAFEVVHRLRDAGFEAVWAGGCVRDALLGVDPKDYDVATSALPDDVIRLFGSRKTVAVGASFGVIVVLGKHKSDGQVEVATFRSDGEYSDGRRPDSVQFCSAEEDARRRDFTINGMFFDPVAEQVIDYVGGQQDLDRGVVRAIGHPEERFEEDKLRMLRAPRIAARFDFLLDEATAAAIRMHAANLNQVSVERIAQELRRMLSHSSRHRSLELLVETTLFSVVFPSVSDAGQKTAHRIMPFLSLPSFEPALAALLQEQLNGAADRHKSRTMNVASACREFKLSNEEISTVCWLCDAFDRCASPAELPLHELKPLLADRRHKMLLDLMEAFVHAELRVPNGIEFLNTYLAKTSAERLDPVLLISGTDLISLGMKPGPEFSATLRLLRNEQLDEKISTHEEAMTRAQVLCSAENH